MILHEAALAWLFVPEVLLGSDFDPSQANAGQKSPAAMAQLQIWHPELRPEHLQAAQHAAKGQPWWQHLSELAASQLSESTGEFSRSLSFHAMAHLRSYPRELLLAAHPEMSSVFPASRRRPEMESGHSGLADLHCHLNGAVPEHALWVAGVAGLLSIPKPSSAQVGDPSRVSNPQALVIEAGFLRWWLAERLLEPIPELLWSQSIERSHEADGILLDADGSGGLSHHLVVANQTLRRFALAHGYSERDGPGAFRDPLQSALGIEDNPRLQIPVPLAELQLQTRLFEVLSQMPNRSSADQRHLKKNAARYLHMRCQFRAYCLLRKNEHGLLAFMRRYGAHRPLFPRAPGQMPRTIHTSVRPDSSPVGCVPRTGKGHRGPSRSRPSIDFKASWCAEQALRASIAGGATATEFRVGFGGSPREVKGLLASYLHGMIKADFDGTHRIAFLHQLHRTQPMGRQEERVHGLVTFLRGAAPDLRSLVTGMDLAGRELGRPPMRAHRAFQNTECLKRDGRFTWSIHAGEEFLHPLSGLRWSDWCLDELPMRQGDRLSHLLALVRPPGPCLIPPATRALDLAWAWRTLKQLGLETAPVEGIFAEIPPKWLSKCPLLSQWVIRLPEGEDHSSLKGPSAQLMQIRPSLWEKRLCRTLAGYVVEKIATRGVIVEVSPSSNIQVVGDPTLKLPIHRWPAKLHWVLGTDDPGLLGNTLEEDLALIGVKDPRRRSPERWKHRLVRNGEPIVGRMRSTGYWRKRLAGLGGLEGLEGLGEGKDAL